MTNQRSNSNADQTQDLELPGNSQIEMPASEGDAPAIRATRRRGKIISPEVASLMSLEGPPPFSGILQLEPKNLKEFQKALKKHSKCSAMKKLVCLDYFASRFCEMAYFEVQDDGQGLKGVLGFGNVSLVTGIQNQTLTENLLPSLFGILAEDTQHKIFTGLIESLRPEDQQGLSQLGYQATQFVGAFPVTYKKAVTGLWLCTATEFQEFTTKELTALGKQFTNFIF